MTDLLALEFTALRSTIQQRGTMKVWLFWATVAAWAGGVVLVNTVMPLPIASLLPLVVLASGFEGVYAVHLGVERVGRYLQVFIEERNVTTTSPTWERTVMAYGERFRGTGPDPLFAPIFLAAMVLNMMAVLLPSPAPVEIVVIGGIHVLAVVRVIAARRIVAAQRRIDLERFRAIRDSAPKL